MKKDLNFVAGIAVLMLLGAAIYVFAPYLRRVTDDYNIQPASHQAPEVPVNRTFWKRYLLTPKQQLTLKNDQFRHIEIRATYSISVDNGQCNQVRVAQFECTNPSPEDIIVVDARPSLSLLNPTANEVTISGRER